MRLLPADFEQLNRSKHSDRRGYGFFDPRLAGDPSAKGLKQSWGPMANYLYDLKRLDRNRAALAQGKIPVSGAIEDLLS